MIKILATPREIIQGSFIKFFKARKFHFPKYKKLCKSRFFPFFELGKLPPEFFYS